MQERLILRRKNNHIERDRRRSFYLALDGRPPWTFRPMPMLIAIPTPRYDCEGEAESGINADFIVSLLHKRGGVREVVRA
jgi:hypothetical protein